MSAYTKEECEAEIALWKLALKEIADSGETRAIAGRTLVMTDVATIRQQILHLERRLTALKRGTRLGFRTKVSY